MKVFAFLVLLSVQVLGALCGSPVTLTLSCQDSGLYDPCTCSRDEEAGDVVVCITFQHFQTLIKHWTCSHPIKVKILQHDSEAWLRCGAGVRPLPRKPKVKEVTSLNVDVITKSPTIVSRSSIESSQSGSSGLLIPNWSLVIIVVVVILIVLVIIKFSSKVRSCKSLHLGENLHWIRCLHPPLRPPGCEYDAFVCYSSQDNVFVEYIFIPELRNRGYKVFYHTRHFSPGERISDNIETAIKKSYCTIIVITSNLVKSGWSSYEFNRALREPRIGNRNHKVVPVVFGEDPNLNDSQMDPSLKEFLLQRSWLHWGTRFFWHRLALRLPASRLGSDTSTDSNSLSALSGCSTYSSPSIQSVSLVEEMQKHLKLNLDPDNEHPFSEKRTVKPQPEISSCKRYTHKDSIVSAKNSKKNSRHNSDASGKSRKHVHTCSETVNTKMHDDVKETDSRRQQPVISVTSESANIHDVVSAARATAFCKEGSGNDQPDGRRFFSVKFKDKIFYIAVKSGKVYVVSPVEDGTRESSQPSRRLQNYATCRQSMTGINNETFNYSVDSNVYDVVKRDLYYNIQDKNWYNAESAKCTEHDPEPSVKNSRFSTKVPKSLEHVVHYKDLKVDIRSGLANVAYEDSEKEEIFAIKTTEFEPMCITKPEFVISPAAIEAIAERHELCAWV